MIKNHIGKYKIETEDNGRIITATATFAKKPVVGKAKYDPNDEFPYDYQYGRNKAILKCAEKINEKRVKNSYKKLRKAQQELMIAMKHYEEIAAYVRESNEETIEIKKCIENIEKEYYRTHTPKSNS